MAHALNLTMKIRQDPEAQAALRKIKDTFTTDIQPKIDEALRKSQIVHFARVVVIDDLYLQVITEYDGDPEFYTEFFRRELPTVFGALFSLADPPPPADGMSNQQAFYDFSKNLQRRSLGTAVDGDTDGAGNVDGYLFSAFGSKTVKNILPRLDAAPQADEQQNWDD